MSKDLYIGVELNEPGEGDIVNDESSIIEWDGDTRNLPEHFDSFGKECPVFTVFKLVPVVIVTQPEGPIITECK